MGTAVAAQYELHRFATICFAPWASLDRQLADEAAGVSIYDVLQISRGTTMHARAVNLFYSMHRLKHALMDRMRIADATTQKEDREDMYTRIGHDALQATNAMSAHLTKLAGTNPRVPSVEQQWLHDLATKGGKDIILFVQRVRERAFDLLRTPDSLATTATMAKIQTYEKTLANFEASVRDIKHVPAKIANFYHTIAVGYRRRLPQVASVRLLERMCAEIDTLVAHRIAVFPLVELLMTLPTPTPPAPAPAPPLPFGPVVPTRPHGLCPRLQHPCQRRPHLPVLRWIHRPRTTSSSGRSSD